MAGARKVYVASAAPALRHQNVYGIDMPAKEEFVAHQRTDDEVGRIIGADMLIYQKLEDLQESAKEGNPNIQTFECSTFDGQYVTGDIDESYLRQVSLARNDKSKERREAQHNTDSNVLELHNHA